MTQADIPHGVTRSAVWGVIQKTAFHTRMTAY
jgi:hypothetical protein